MTSQPKPHTPSKPSIIPSKFHSFHLQKLPPEKASQYSLVKNLFSPRTRHFHFNDCQSLSIKKSKNIALKTAKLHLSSYIFSPESETSHFLINPYVFRHLRKIHSLEIIICDHAPDQKLDKGLTCNGCLDTFTLLTSIIRHNPFRAASLQHSSGQDLFKDMRRLKSLKKLYLNFTSVSRVDIQKISQAIISSKILAKISLVLRLPLMTNLQTSSFSRFLPKFHRLTHFELDLTNNTASSKTLNALLLSLKGLTRLQELHFTFRKASMIPVDLHSFKEAVKNMKNLQALYLNFTSIELIRGSTEDLGEGLRSLKNLKALRLSLVKCQFQHESVVSLGRLLGKMDFVRVLEINLVSSNLESRLLTGFMGALKSLERLEEFSLKISNNKLDDYVLGKIVEVLKGYKRAKRIELAGDSCGFSDKGMRNLVDLTQGMGELRELKLSFSVNRLIKDEGVKMLMDGILEGRRLEKLKADFRICGVSKEFKEAYVEKVKSEFPSIEDSVLFTSSSG